MATAVRSDELLPERLRSCLGTRFFGAEIQHYRQIESTQLAAAAAAQRGASEGTLILAETQTRGRGRHGHSWASPPGAGIYASLVLRPNLTAPDMLWLTLAAGLAIADGVIEVAGLTAELRWPNDLLLAGRKFCGVLVETSLEGDRLAYAILGFGINVRVRPWPPELAEVATALEAHARQPVSRLLLCASVLRHLEERYLHLSGATGHAELQAEFERRSRYARGLEVCVGGSGTEPFIGRTAGLDGSGFLQVRLTNGDVRTVTHGDVRPA